MHDCTGCRACSLPVKVRQAQEELPEAWRRELDGASEGVWVLALEVYTLPGIDREKAFEELLRGELTEENRAWADRYLQAARTGPIMAPPAGMSLFPLLRKISRKQAQTISPVVTDVGSTQEWVRAVLAQNSGLLPPDGKSPPLVTKGTGMETQLKQILVLRTDLNMRKGKMVAQGAHASQLVLLNIQSESNEAWKQWYREWMAGPFTKICVGVGSESEMRELEGAASAAGFPTALITDSGLTEFHGIPTVTALGIGPAPAERLALITGALKLL